MIRGTGPFFRAYAASPVSAAERDEAGRVWCTLFPLGTWHRKDFPEGRLDLTPALMASFIANWRAGGSPALPVDYEHKEDGPASGWIEDLRVSPAGELEGAIKWTDEAASDIKADRRRYLSPTWAMAHVNRRTGEKGGPWLYGAALTNSPFYDSMPRVAASSATAEQHDTTPSTEALRGEEKHMELKRICAALGLSEGSTEQDVEKHLSQLKASQIDTEKLTAAVKSQVEPLQAQLKASQEKQAELEKQLITRDVDALMASAKAEGRAVEPMREFVLKAAQTEGIDAAKRMVAALPVTLSTTEKGISGKDEKRDDSPEALRASVAEYSTKLEAFAKERGLSIVNATRIFNRDNPELAKRAFSAR